MLANIAIAITFLTLNDFMIFPSLTFLWFIFILFIDFVMYLVLRKIDSIAQNSVHQLPRKTIIYPRIIIANR